MAKGKPFEKMSLPKTPKYEVKNEEGSEFVGFMITDGPFSGVHFNYLDLKMDSIPEENDDAHLLFNYHVIEAAGKDTNSDEFKEVLATILYDIITEVVNRDLEK